MTSEKYHDDEIIDESDHDLQLKQKVNDNSIPKSMVKLEYLYDIKDKFKKVTNEKLQNYTLRFELVNIRTEAKPQNVNLGLELTS